MKQFLYRGNTLGQVYDEIFSDDKGSLLESDFSGSGRRIRVWISERNMVDYEEYVAPVVDVRYGFITLDGIKQFTRGTRAPTDNLKATWIDGKLTSVEIIR